MKIASKEYVIKRMSSLMINPKKKYSQNFLVDYDVVKRSVDNLSLSVDDIVVEIGPGLGALTQEILDRGNQVYAYEIDEDMYRSLKEEMKLYPNLHLENVDFLKVDLSFLKNKSVKVISNVPYNLTTPIIEKIVTSDIDIKVFEFMVQKEVYDRIKAKTGSKDYSPLNIYIEYVGTLSLVMKVNKDKFIPAPNVDSVILKIDFNKERVSSEVEKVMFPLIKASFAQRRKTMLNNLTLYIKSKEMAKDLLEKSNINESIRGEALNLTEYLLLSKNYLNMKK